MTAADDLSQLSDSELIELITAQDARALETLYDRYSRVIYSFALRIVGDQEIAEEIMQEVFFRAWQQGKSFQTNRGTLITWLLSITHNLSIDEVRKRKRRPQKADSSEPELLMAGLRDETQSVEDEVWVSSLRTIMVDALAQLPDVQREAIEMAYFKGLTQREIAERTGEPLGTIKTRTRLGMLKLREFLGNDLTETLTMEEVDVS